jgi:hypothetical protein
VIALACGAYHACTAGGCELDGKCAHTTGGGMDQQRLTGADVELLEHSPRGAPRAG